MEKIHRKNLAENLATLGPVGELPAPGTMGSLVTVLLLAGCALLFSWEAMRWMAILASLVLLVPAAIWAGRAEKRLGKDAPQIVIDEVVGQLLAAVFVQNWWQLLLAFALFRFFDISKILGINALQKIKGGWGILWDDVAAGAYAALVIGLVRYFFL